MTILVHDGRRPGHAGWAKEAVDAGQADGVILNPFQTPPVSISRHPSATEVIADLRGSLFAAHEPEILFDSATWAATLPGTDFVQVYDQWSLWPHRNRCDLQDSGAISDHVRAVFAIQRELGVPYLAPSVKVDAPMGPTAELAIDLAAEAGRQQPHCMITICGTNPFWRAGPALDAYVGRLARLRPSGCYVIPLRDKAGYPSDLTDSVAVAGWLRTIHSLAIRSRIIAGYTDHLGIVAAAAGANTIGTGWDQGQRTANPDNFRVTEPGGQSVNYSPHPGLLARFSVAVAVALQDLAATFAGAMRWDQPIPTDMRENRGQHFSALNAQVNAVITAGPTPTDRVVTVRHMLAGADLAWNYAISQGAQGVGNGEKAAWLGSMSTGFEAYVRAER